MKRRRLRQSNPQSLRQYLIQFPNCRLCRKRQRQVRLI